MMVADVAVGTVLMMAAVLEHPGGYMVADGRCLPDAEYRDLAAILQDRGRWPYGRCSAGRFHLPNLCTIDGCRYIIRVRP